MSDRTGNAAIDAAIDALCETCVDEFRAGRTNIDTLSIFAARPGMVFSAHFGHCSPSALRYIARAAKDHAEGKGATLSLRKYSLAPN